MAFKGSAALPVSGLEDLLEAGAVAERLRLSRGTIVRWILEGKIPGVKLDGVWHVRQIDCKKPPGKISTCRFCNRTFEIEKGSARLRTHCYRDACCKRAKK